MSNTCLLAKRTKIKSWSFLAPLKEIPQERFYQSRGTYRKTKPCCFGAHLAHVLLKKSLGNKSDFRKGGEEFRRRLGGITNSQICWLFGKVGLRVKPFSNAKWNLRVDTVINRLEKIKVIPRD